MCELYFDDKFSDDLKAAILATYRAKERVRIFYGDPKTGKVWPEEFETTGTIGRSTGERKVPLLIANRRSLGGGALSPSIVGVKTKYRWFYKHPAFNLGVWEVGLDCVYHNDKLHARFPSHAKAERYVEFMTGKRMAK